MKQDAFITKYFKTAVILSGSMIGSLLIYLVVVEIIQASLKPFTGLITLDDPQFLRYIFYFIAALQIIVIRLLRGVLLKAGKSDSEEKPVLRIFRVTILTLALAEIPALLGLVLFLLAGMNKDFYILLLVSFVLMFMFFPRINHWKALIIHENE